VGHEIRRKQWSEEFHDSFMPPLESSARPSPSLENQSYLGRVPSGDGRRRPPFTNSLRLDEICRQELDSFRQENGPFSKDQDEMLNAVMSRMTQRIAGSLARELKELPEKVQQEQMTTALRQLFHLQPPETALAGTRP
jgi:Glutamyl-tRNAGlu reductase, dimerisation domain